MKEQRSKQMQEVAERNALQYMERHIGQVVQVLIEEPHGEGSWSGHTDNYLHVQVEGTLTRNSMVQVLLTEIDGKIMKGKIYC